MPTGTKPSEAAYPALAIGGRALSSALADLRNEQGAVLGPAQVSAPDDQPSPEQVATPAAPVGAVPTTSGAPAPSSALARDAEEYARHYGLPPAQALAELAAQVDSVAATDRIAATFADRLAGIAVLHAPLRIVVRLAGTEPVPDRVLALDGLAVPVSFRTGALATRAQLLAAITRRQAAIRDALVVPPGLAADPRSGRLLVAVGGADLDAEGRDALADRLSAVAGVPVEVATPGAAADLVLAGGDAIGADDPAVHRRFSCTAGFAVADAGGPAITTAAHCPDTLTAAAPGGGRTLLPYAGAWGAFTQDVQVNRSPEPLLPVVRAGGVARLVTGARPRAAARAGDWVCHAGERSGYSCAEVLFADYAPPGDLCAGPCAPDWVAVAGPDCAHGDSGGPVFLGTVALGLVKGGSFRGDGGCDLYYYMSVDYLPPGWRLLTGEAVTSTP